MQPNENKPSFMDRGTIIAFAIILLFWFGWSKYMDKQQPAPAATATSTAAAPALEGKNGVEGNAAVTKKDPMAPTEAKADADPANQAAVSETIIPFKDANWSFDISNRGMGIKDVRLSNYKSRDGQTIQLSSAKEDPSFATGLFPYDKPVFFNVQQTAPDTFVGKATVDGTTIEKTMKINSSKYVIDTTVRVTGLTEQHRSVSTRIADIMTEPATKKGFFDPTPDFLSWFVRHEDTKTREALHRKDGHELVAPNVSVASLSVHYFAMAVVDQSSLRPRFESKVPANADIASGVLFYEPSSAPEVLEVKYAAFAGPKDHTLLTSIDENLGQVVDYGMFSIIAKPILWLLRFLNSMIANWGISIIVLTIIVRLIVLPFNVYSYKSMKVMQKLQPQMNAIRERYKDKSNEEKLKMNQEIMGLMKQNKANPLGGCLPMLLQLPVFLALYQVLGQSIELYQAPFGLWIHDLSVRDPYFVLPVLMGITMFVQQKITPSTMDPAQAKVLMWMPVIFSVFMISLPSGLTLYIFVSTLFGIIQQFVFMRDRTGAKTVTAAKA
jgi:YidC/Oxa1 family membrane protein insertase